MNRIRSEGYWRQRVIQEVLLRGMTVTQAARLHHVSRMSIYRWLKRYDGTVESLTEKSHRPQSHPNQHTKEENALIRNVFAHRKALGLVCFYMVLRVQHGYRRSLSSLYCAMRRLGLICKKKRRKKRINKPYYTPQVPGEKVQIDVKYVPRSCCVGKTGKLYQYTAVDECSRLRFRVIYDEHSSYNAARFLDEAIKFFPFKIQCVQTDNGTEFTNALLGSDKLSVFEARCEEKGILHKRIRVATPRHNGKVERTHRTDQERFYNLHTFYSIEDANRQIRRYQYQDNRFPLGVLGWKSPVRFLQEFSPKLSHIN